MQLPGGLIIDGQRRRSFAFRAITGEIERGIVESGAGVNSLPEQVSKVLTLALAEIGGEPADTRLVDQLCSGDRVFLIQRLDALLDPSPRWMTAHCINCQELIQFQLSPADLPIKPAGEHFPECSLPTTVGQARVRVATGSDEVLIAAQSDNDAEAMNRLLHRLISFTSAESSITDLTSSDLEQLDAALDEMSPQVCSELQMACPDCGIEQTVHLDPYAWLAHRSGNLESDIHTLALYYHWSETDILGLPKQRRERYLDLIDRSRGRYQAESIIASQQRGGA